MAAEAFRDDPRWPAGAERLLDAGQVAEALDDQARRLAAVLPVDAEVSFLALMKGGMYPTIALSRRLERALAVDYVHATRYRDRTRGGDIEWVHWPEPARLAEHVVVVDDIFDEGHTMAAVVERLKADGHRRVTTAVLALKRHERGLPRDWVDDHALEVPDRYVFGCGMDYRGLWRQLDDIWALPA
jgi:hypoxanthine phosphoribosyltransferase